MRLFEVKTVEKGFNKNIVQMTLEITCNLVWLQNQYFKIHK